MLPCARSRGIGNGNEAREPMASCQPIGSPSASAATASRLSGFVTTSKLSMTSAPGRLILAIAATSHRGTSGPAPDEASARNTLGSIASMRSSATAM